MTLAILLLALASLVGPGASSAMGGTSACCCAGWRAMRRVVLFMGGLLREEQPDAAPTTQSPGDRIARAAADQPRLSGTTNASFRSEVECFVGGATDNVYADSRARSGC